MKDYYKILGVEKNSSSILIRKTYRKMAIKLHPDVNKATNAHEQFTELLEAYEVLKSPNLRAKYDRLINYHLNNRKRPVKNNSYQQHSTNWETKVSKSSQRGRRKAHNYSTQTGKKFERKTKRTRWFDYVLAFFRVFGAIIEGIASVV